MKKSQLEKALELVPKFKGDLQEMSGGEFDIEDAYGKLRTVELAYEQLVSMGHDVLPSLKERRYQIAYLIAKVVGDEMGEIQNMVENRSNEDWLGDLPKITPRLITGVRKLDTYLRKLYPDSYKNEKQEISELFPEPQ